MKITQDERESGGENSKKTVEMERNHKKIQIKFNFKRNK